jgi:hypothetical protein
MRRPTPALFTLGVFWTLYALAAAWTLYGAALPAGRDLLLILGGYGAVLAVVSGAILLRAWLRSSGKRPH